MLAADREATIGGGNQTPMLAEVNYGTGNGDLQLLKSDLKHLRMHRDGSKKANIQVMMKKKRSVQDIKVKT